ncbi:MAG: LPS export ABC transporter permease LptG [Inquilinaceae bacterium]
MMPSTLPLYITRQFLRSFLSLLVILIAVIGLFELLEMLRRAGNRDDVGVAAAIEMTLLKMPFTVQYVFHFIVLFAAMLTFWRLTRSQELVVARASGVSAWQFLLPVVVAAALIGVAKVGVVNPIGAMMYGKYEELQNQHFRGRTSVLDISGGGIWLRQRNDDGPTVIFAERAAPQDLVLENVIVFLFDPRDRFTSRIDARMAALKAGYWDLTDAHIQMADGQARLEPLYRLPTDLTPDRIQESFASPETLSFWDMPDFIEDLERTGFSALQHRLYFKSLLAQPLMMAAMVLFGAVFSLRQTRRGGTLLFLISGIVTAFVVFVSSDVILALGLAQSIPPDLAAWAPAGVSALIGVAATLHLEDG